VHMTFSAVSHESERLRRGVARSRTGRITNPLLPLESSSRPPLAIGPSFGPDDAAVVAPDGASPGSGAAVMSVVVRLRATVYATASVQGGCVDRVDLVLSDTGIAGRARVCGTVDASRKRASRERSDRRLARSRRAWPDAGADGRLLEACGGRSGFQSESPGRVTILQCQQRCAQAHAGCDASVVLLDRRR
jgi:hypothetical protein